MGFLSFLLRQVIIVQFKTVPVLKLSYLRQINFLIISKIFFSFLYTSFLWSLPSFLLRFFLLKNPKHACALSSFFQDFFFGMIFAYIASLNLLLLFLLGFFHLIFAIDAFLYKKLGIRFSLSHCFLLPSLANYLDSAHAIGAFHFFPVFISYLLVPLIIHPISSSFTPSLFLLLIPFLGFCYLSTKKRDKAQDHLLFLFYVKIHNFLLQVYKSKSFFSNFSLSIFSIEKREKYHLLDPNYPTLRKTVTFLGEKTFTLDLNPSSPPHIVFLFLESFRASEMGFLGSKTNLTPHLDKLAEKSIVFSNFFANSINTHRAMVASLFGTFYRFTPQIHPKNQERLIGIQEILKKKNYQTNFFEGSSHEISGAPSLTIDGFDYQLDRRDLKIDYPEAEEQHWGVVDEYLLKAFVSHLEKNQKSPQFYAIFTITNHHPWIAPASYPKPSFLKSSGYFFYDHYLHTLSYTDYCIGQMMKNLQEKNLANKVLFFILGDHGINFSSSLGEPSSLSFRSLDQDNLHVPLMIHFEGKIHKPQMINAYTSQFDLLPTVMDLLNLKEVHHSLGCSLQRKLPDRPLFFHNPFIEESLGFLKYPLRGNFNPNIDRINLYNIEQGIEKETTSDRLTQKQKKDLDKIKKDLLLFSPFFKKFHLVPKRWNPKKEPQPIKDRAFYVPKTLSPEAFEKVASKKTPIHFLSGFLTDHTLSKMAENHPEIIALDLSCSSEITDQAMENFLLRCEKVKKLILRNCFKLTHQTLTYLFKIPYLTQLEAINTSLFLHKPPLQLSKRSLDSLKSLSLGPCTLDQDDAFFLQKAFPKISILTLFRIQSPPSLLIKLLGNYNLDHLYLIDYPHLHDDFLRHFALNKRQRKKLKSLTLSECSHLTDQSIKMLSQLSLLSLELRGCTSLTDQAFVELAKIPLKYLKITNCHQLTWEGLTPLKAKKKKYYTLLINEIEDPVYFASFN